MTKDVYIIRRNSPESRLLSHIGFDRNTLEVAEWRGRRRSRGGYGKAAVAWRVAGEPEVRRLCEGIVRIIGARPASQLTPEDQKALERAQRTLRAFRNRAVRAASIRRVSDDRAGPIASLLSRQMPLATADDIERILAAVAQSPPSSLAGLHELAKSVLGQRPAIWLEARTAFIAAMHGDKPQLSRE